MGTFTIERVVMNKMIVPLKHPFKTKLQHVQERVSIIVQLWTSKGSRGLGECVAFTTPWYTEETVKMAWYVMKHYLVPLLQKGEYRHPNEVYEQFQSIKGNRMAKAALEQAVWDAYAKDQQLPLYALLGGKRRHIPAGVVVTWQTEEELRRKVEAAKEEGYERVKIKISPQSNVDVLRSLVQTYDDLLFFGDANGSFTKCPTTILEQFDTVGFRLLEQPFGEDDWLDHQTMTKKANTPIALDESIHSLADAKRMMRMQAGDCIVLKPGRVGGTARSVRLIEAAAERQVDVWLGGMIEFGISKAHNLALASLPGVTLPGDFSASDHFWERDIVQPPLTVQQGVMTIPEGDGIGVTLDEDVLHHYEYKRFES